MVGSTSFSSGARISVIPSFAVQSIAAPCIGCQKDSFWNGRHRGDFTHHGQDHSVDVARGIPTGYSSTVRGSTVQWPLFIFSHLWSTGTYNTSIFSGTVVQLLCPCVLQLVAGSCPNLSHFKWVFLMSHGSVRCHFQLPCYWWFVLNTTTTPSTV